MNSKGNILGMQTFFYPKPFTPGREYRLVSLHGSPDWLTETLNLVIYECALLAGEKCSLMYFGAKLLCILKTWQRVTWFTLSNTGNQFSLIKSSFPICDLGSRFKTNLISLFWVTRNLDLRFVHGVETDGITHQPFLTVAGLSGVWP